MTVSILDEMEVKRAVAVKVPLLDGLSERYISSSGLSLPLGEPSPPWTARAQEMSLLVQGCWGK